MNCFENSKRKLEEVQKNHIQHIHCYGPTGATGPTGSTGVTGPTGATGPGSSLNGLQMQLNYEGYLEIEPNKIFVFNNIINQSSSSIAYNNTTGEITFDRNANYYISWWVVIDGTGGTTDISVSFTNGTTTIHSSSPLVTGQLSGSALISVINTPEVWALKNTTIDTLGLTTQLIHANITICEIS